jgi:hypothetical protein
MVKEKQLTRQEKIENAKQLLNELYSTALEQESLDTPVGEFEKNLYEKFTETTRPDLV